MTSYTPLSELEDGIYDSIPAGSYHRRELGLVSNSALSVLAKTASKYKAWVERGSKATEAMEFGTAFHTSLLEPEVFEKTYAVAPNFGDRRFKANKEAAAAWHEENEGRLALSAADDAAIRGMSAAITLHPAASALLTGGVSETTIIWTDPDTGLKCKARSDYWKRGDAIVVDLKTCEDASEESFAKSVYNYRYHRQQALYSLGMSELHETPKHYVLIAIEKSYPHDLAVYYLDDAAIAAGRQLARAGLERMKHCLDTNSWPGYGDGIIELSLPAWTKTR